MKNDENTIKKPPWRWPFIFEICSDLKSRTTNFQCSARGHSLGRCSDLWSGLSDHDLSICRHSPFNVLPHIDSSRSNSATLGRRFSFRYRWIYLLEKSIETLLCWNQEPIGILQQRWKFLNFCRQGLAYRPLPAPGRWNSFRFACAVAGNRKNRWIPLVQDKQIQGLISYFQNDTLTARGLQADTT